MRSYPRGFIVQRTDLEDVVLEGARSYTVTDDGELVFSTGDVEAARFAAGTWVAVRRVGIPLREEWPPDDFDALMASLTERLVVGYGLDVRYPLEPLLDPLFNDFDAFVDAVSELEGGVGALDSEHRRWIASSVAEVFGIVPRLEEVGRPLGP